MNKIVRIVLFFTLIQINKSYSQPSIPILINPYLDYAPFGTMNPSPSYEGDAYYNNLCLIKTQDTYRYPPLTGQNNYKGEYEILLYDLFWHTDAPYSSLAKSFKYEVVSFPFTMSCALNTQGCASTSQNRNLEMPSNYNSSTNLWDDYLNRLSLGSFDATGRSFIPTVGTCPDPNHNCLISVFLYENYGVTFPLCNRDYLPHSVIKCTINLHCTADINDPIISSFSFYYDNTRGRMRYYPFSNTNLGPPQPIDHDVIFLPTVLKDWCEDMLYDDNESNALYTDLVGTINQYKVSEINNNGCTSTLSNLNVPTSNTDVFYNGAIFNYPYPSPETLIEAPLKETYGTTLAGYQTMGANTGLVKNDGIIHHYHIDKNIDLSIINPTEKTIYNPSEVIITSNATNLIFPEQYTFKTINGSLPNINMATDDDIPENGGPYSDLRDVPVTTDLSTESTTDAVDFPLSAQTATKHLYASRYYLENGSKLTIQNCVRLLDATFDVRQGATLWCTAYPTILGKEDHSFDRNHTRFKFQTLGGAVLRNGAAFQYLQNGIITQTIPLHYTATNAILAGKDVETDNDVPKNDFSIEATGDVTLEASNTIYLKEGFRAKDGCSFRAFTQPQGFSVACPAFQSGPSPGNRLMNTEKSSGSLATLQALPNPSQQGLIKLSYSGLPINDKKIEVRNAMGKLIYQKNEFMSATDLINLTSEPNGLYLATVYFENRSESVKIILLR